MSTLDEVRKAYEDLSEDDKKSFHQSIADRVHESIAAQEEDKGETDSQTAEDREHEALGAEHADGKGDVEEFHETDPEDGGAADDTLAKILDRLAAIESKIASTAKEESDSDKLDAARAKYGMAQHSTADGSEKKEFTDEDIRKLLG